MRITWIPLAEGSTPRFSRSCLLQILGHGHTAAFAGLVGEAVKLTEAEAAALLTAQRHLLGQWAVRAVSRGRRVGGLATLGLRAATRRAS